MSLGFGFNRIGCAARRGKGREVHTSLAALATSLKAGIDMVDGGVVGRWNWRLEMGEMLRETEEFKEEGFEVVDDPETETQEPKPTDRGNYTGIT